MSEKLVTSKEKPPHGVPSSHKTKTTEPGFRVKSGDYGSMRRSRSLQWTDRRELEKITASDLDEPSNLSRTTSLTKLSMSATEEFLSRKNLSSSNILALSDSSLSLKEALPEKLFVDNNSVFGAERSRLIACAQMYYHQLTKGCGQKQCDTTFCSSNPNCPYISQELRFSLCVVLAMSKGKYLCCRRAPIRRVFPSVSVQSKSGCKKVNFLTKLFSMSSFSSLFKIPVKPDAIVASKQSNAYDTNTSHINTGTDNPSTILQLTNTVEKSLPTHTSAQIKGSLLQWLDTPNHIEANVTSTERIDVSYDCKTGGEGKEHFSLTHLNIQMLSSVIEQYNECKDNKFLKATLRTVFASKDALENSFLPQGIKESLYEIDRAAFDDVKQCYKMLLDIDTSRELFCEVNSSISILLSELRQPVPNSSTTNVWPLIIVLKNPKLFDSSELSLRLCEVVHDLDDYAKGDLIEQLSFSSRAELETLIHEFENLLSVITEVRSHIKDRVFVVCEVLSLLHRAIFTETGDQSKQDDKIFYNENFSKSLDLVQELSFWKTRTHQDQCRSKDNPTNEGLDNRLSFIQFSFLLLPETKIQILHLEAMMQMKDQYQTALVHQVKIQHMHKVSRGFNPNDLSADVRSAACPYLVLNVARENIVQGTLELLRKKEKDLKKPLKVVFTGKGEQGLDLGGLQKEFFQIFFQEVLSPDYGLFESVKESGFTWFKMDTEESVELFKVIGMVIGIAIYNGIILDLQFPSVLYRKLLGFRTRLDDLEEVHPMLKRSLESLQSYDGDVESAFCLSFQVTQDIAGRLKTVNLIEHGYDVVVTNENKEEFIHLYIDYLLNRSVKNQFEAFSQGFFKVCGDGAIKLFNPYELDLLICGSPEFDFHALEKVTTYYGGFSTSHYLIREFWRIVHKLDDQQKHKLLNFVTGSHRVPVGGLGALSFAIQRSGSNTDNLPTAMTCFNRLFLPCYSDKRILEEKLILAIENCQGFGLV